VTKSISHFEIQCCVSYNYIETLLAVTPLFCFI